MTKEEAIKYLQQLYPNGGQCWLDEQRIEAIGMAIQALQEESVSDDFEMALAEMIDKAQTSVVEPWVIAAQWKDELIKLAKSEEPVSEDLEKEMDFYFMKMQVHENENIFETSFKDIARHFVNWQKNHLWKPADGDDLPEIDREVIALTQPYPLGGNEYVVSFAFVILLAFS